MLAVVGELGITFHDRAAFRVCDKVINHRIVAGSQQHAEVAEASICRRVGILLVIFIPARIKGKKTSFCYRLNR